MPEEHGEKSLAGPAPVYRVVATKDIEIPGGRDPGEVLAEMRQGSLAKLSLDAWRSGQESDWEQTQVGVVNFAYHALPFGAAFDSAAEGNYGEAAISLAGDVAMFLGPLGKVAQLAGTAARNLRLGAATIEGGIAAARATQGVLALRDGETGQALGYFGEATLRLLGMSKDAVRALKKPALHVGAEAPQTVKKVAPSFKTGEDAEKYLATQLLPDGQPQFRLPTGIGTGATRFRIIDVLDNGIAHESKVGYTKLTDTVQKQIAKDAWLMKNNPEVVKGAVWHFFRSVETGKMGADPEVLEALEKNGIRYVIHE